MPTSKIGLHDLDPSLFETLSNISGSNSQTKIFPLQVVASEDNQTIFPIGLDTFDAETDFAFVQSGVTNLFYGADFTIENKNIILKEGVPAGRTLGIYVLKNVEQIDEEDYVSGTNLAPGSVTPDKIGGILPIEKGGTGANSAEEARANLGINDEDYLPLAGGTLSGSIYIKGNGYPHYVLEETTSGRAGYMEMSPSGVLWNINKLDNSNLTALYLNPEGSSSLLKLRTLQNNVDNYYDIFGTHNKDLLKSVIQEMITNGEIQTGGESVIRQITRGTASTNGDLTISCNITNPDKVIVLLDVNGTATGSHAAKSGGSTALGAGAGGVYLKSISTTNIVVSGKAPSGNSPTGSAYPTMTTTSITFSYQIIEFM